MTLKVFISYAREDEPQAQNYYNLLLKAGTSPWLDVRNLLPGQNWEVEIERAFKEAHVVVLLLSNKSVNKRGFVQREANDAIERLRYKKPTDIYILPLLLESCDVPSNISDRLQYTDLNTPGAWEQVKASLKIASEQQSIELERGISVGPFSMYTETLKEEWVGLPGHSISIEYPRFESISNENFAKEISEFFSGRAFSALIKNRQIPWDQDPNFFSEHSSTAMNGRWDSFGIVHATDRFISISYDVGWYGAGAAHPQSYFETYNFGFLDRVYRLQLSDFFHNINAALKIISEKCLNELSREHWVRTGERPNERDINWFKEGLCEKLDNFDSFTVGNDHFTFLFPPYQVSCYAMGQWSVDVSFFDLLDFLKHDGPYLLVTIKQ